MKTIVEHRSVVWLAVMVLFVRLLALANRHTDGETFHGPAPITTVAVVLLGLFGVHRATAESDAWAVDTRNVIPRGLGTALYVVLACLCNGLLGLSIGEVMLRPTVCVRVLFGHSFGTGIGFFTGAVGKPLGKCHRLGRVPGPGDRQRGDRPGGRAGHDSRR